MTFKDAASGQGVQGQHDLQRHLTNRHIQLIAIGGAIGTGLFMGSGKTIDWPGPSIVLVYIIGVMVFFFVIAPWASCSIALRYESDMGARRPARPLGEFAYRLDLWFCWIVTGIADVIAISAYAQFWFPDLPQWAPALACVGLLLGLNLLTVRLFGEIEFWFAMIKIVAIVTLVGTGVAMVAGGFVSPAEPRSRPRPTCGPTAACFRLWTWAFSPVF